MPLDSFCLSGIIRELQPVVGLRIEKIQQPARDQVVLALRGGRRLLLCAGAAQARIHFTALSRENPASPPMFCMLLRKHLGGGRIAAIQQPGRERAAILTVDVVDELGEPGQRRLILECMGRRSNLILTDGEGRIIDCLRRIDLEMSETRQVLPGLYYRLPPPQAKADPLAADAGELEVLFSSAPSESCAPTRAPSAGASQASPRAGPGPRDGRPSSPGTWNSCPCTGTGARDPPRRSTRPRCRGSSGRA